jgi:hypothetical protein
MDQGVNERDRPVNVRPDQGGERPRIEIYDPPLCCPTGLCGPTADPVLLDLNEALLTLKSEEVASRRYLLNTHPQAFVSNPDVFRLLREKQIAVLPITVVDGAIAKTGAYPSLAELREFLALRNREPG